jgi:hypothetical protein
MATATRYRGSWQVAANVPNLQTAIATNQDGDYWMAATADPNVPELAPAGVPGVAGSPVANGDGILWDGTAYAITTVPVAPGIASSCYSICTLAPVTQAPPFWPVPAAP